MKIIVLILALAFSSIASASVYTTTDPDGGVGVWSTIGTCQPTIYRTCYWTTKTMIGIKYPSKSYYILLYPYGPWGNDLNGDINWTANYGNQNNIAWVWGTCLQARTIYNATNCLYVPYIYP